MSRGLLALAVTASLCASCRQPATQLVVLVDTDYAVPGEMSDLHVEVSAEDGSEPFELDFALIGRGESMPPRFALPLSFGVVPTAGDAERRVLISVSGLAPGRAELVTRRARTGFLSNRSLLLPIFLLRSCEGVVCSDGQTCIDAVCEDDEVDPLLLRPIAPGEERDSGLVLVDAGDDADAGFDGGFDGGADGGADAGLDSGADAAIDGGASVPRFVRHLGSGTCGSVTTDVSITEPVPAGDILVVSVVWRAGPPGGVAVTDTQMNDYRPVLSAIGDNPDGALLVGTVRAPLGPGDTVSITHPMGDAVGVVVDQLSGVRSTPAAFRSTREFERNVAVSISTPSPGLVYAVLGSFANTAFTPTGAWVSAADVSMMCPTGFGDFDHRTLHMPGGVGTHTLTGDFPMRRSYIAMLVVFDAP